MSRRLLAIVVAACGHVAAPPPGLGPPGVPRLLPPAPIDPQARGAAYLTAIAVQLQPGWGQFLDDCRLRLAATHPLNQMSLTARAELVIDRRGRVVDVQLAGSGNADFDRAVHDAIADTGVIGAPPEELLSDDDRLHVRWLFARDRRQAGPATAEVMWVELPLPGVIDRLVARQDLARAARRIAIAPDGPDRQAATERLMIAALHEAIGGADSAARRAAIDAIGRAKVRQLAHEVRALLEVTSDAELRLVAASAIAALGDTEAAPVLLAELPADLPEHPRLAVAEAHALAALGHTADVAAVLRTQLEATGASPPTIALRALAAVSVPELDARLAGWAQHGDARTRAAACAAFGGAAPGAAWPGILRGLRDADATVRASCAEASAGVAGTQAERGPAIARLHELTRDRDRAVRAHALAALGVLDPAHLPSAGDDPAAEVRAAFASALAGATVPQAEADLRALVDDRDPDVRAAAWGVLASDTPARAPADRAKLAAHAVTDPAAQVRRAALAAVDDDDVLAHLAASDDAPDVRTEAIVLLAGRRGRTAIGPVLLDRLAAAPPASSDRVRIAVAWLLAR